MKKKNWKKILLAVGMCIGVLTGIVVIFLISQILQAPKISEIDATPEGYLSTILDKDGNVVNNLYITESNRIYVSLDSIPANLQKAFIAIEDARFYNHNGIDLQGIVRAFFHGIANGKFSQGASTITQQLLKNNVFTDWMSEENFYDRLCRKVQEQYLSIRLEQEYSKEWILENYLNTINLGGGTRGVQVATQYYFGKDVSQLSLAESALLAGITKNPSAYNPLTHPEESIGRQKLVLNAMLEQGYITQEEYETAQLEDIMDALNTDAENRGMRVFSWFEDAMLLQIVEDLMSEYQYDEVKAWDMIYSGGLTIYSTVDTNLQNICEDTAVNKNWYTDNQEISIVMTDVSNGAVRAIVGSSKEKTNSLVYNRAIDAVRQPGSLIKIIGEYAATIDTGQISLGTVIDDEPYTYSDGTSIRNATGTYNGMTTIRKAIADSSNVVALKTFQMAGIETVYNYLKKFGITTLSEDDFQESLAIGGTYNGVTNLEVTAAYNAIANSGEYVKPYFYTKVIDRDGNVVLETEVEREQIINNTTAELLTSAMESVITEGTGTSAAVNGLSLAGKSGTTNEKKDLWFVGFSSYYTCGIWGGYDDNSSQTDSTYVKKIWKEIMQKVHRNKINQSITDTSNLVQATICTKCGNLAVEGLCNSTVQGNMMAKEYYVIGTEPVRRCDCHISVTICKESGAIAGNYCPDDEIETKVYLRTATQGTVDRQYVFDDTLEEKCSVHKYFWSDWFDNNDTWNDNSWESDSSERYPLDDNSSDSHSFEDYPLDEDFSNDRSSENWQEDNRPSDFWDSWFEDFFW